MDRNHEWWNTDEDPVPDIDDDAETLVEDAPGNARQMILLIIGIVCLAALALYVVNTQLKRGASAASTTAETVVQK